MITMSKILVSVGGLAIVASAAPASAQYAPGYNGGYNNGYNQSGGVVGAVINSVLGGGRYGAYGQGYGQQYGQGYNRYQAMRVTAITDVQRRSSGLRVSGLLSSGRGYVGGGYGGQYGYQNRGYAQGDLSFRCNVDYRGAVTGLRVRPANYR